jgi:hypothetical protein
MQVKEIPEANAPPDIAALYADMRRCMQLPVVNLIYRTLATMDGALPWVWAALRPAALSGALDASAKSLTDAVPRIELAATTVPEADRDGILHVVDGYNRGNSLNLVGLMAVKRLLTPPHASARAAPATLAPDSAPPPLPRILKLSELQPEIARKVEAIAALHGTGGIVPSIYLHLAHWPQSLLAVCERIAPHVADGSVARACEAAVVLARAETDRLLPSLGAPGAPPPAHTAQMDQAIDLYTSRLIPQLLPVGLSLASALR